MHMHACMHEQRTKLQALAHELLKLGVSVASGERLDCRARQGIPVQLQPLGNLGVHTGRLRRRRRGGGHRASVPLQPGGGGGCRACRRAAEQLLLLLQRHVTGVHCCQQCCNLQRFLINC